MRDQKHLQLSAVSRHLEATEGSLCVERIVAVDPRERMRGAPVTWRTRACISRHWRHSDAQRPAFGQSPHNLNTAHPLCSLCLSFLLETTIGRYRGSELGVELAEQRCSPDLTVLLPRR